MALPVGVLRLMQETCTIRLKTNEDAYGNHVYGSPFTVRCRVDRSEQRVVGSDGESITFSGRQAYLAEDQPLMTSEAKVTLPDGTEPPVKEVARYQWPDGSYHTVVYF